jgi:hypothetical protein
VIERAFLVLYGMETNYTLHIKTILAHMEIGNLKAMHKFGTGTRVHVLLFVKNVELGARLEIEQVPSQSIQIGYWTRREIGPRVQEPLGS